MDSVTIGLIASGSIVGFLLLVVVGWCLYSVYWRKKCCGADLEDDEYESDEGEAERERRMKLPPASGPLSSRQPNGVVTRGEQNKENKKRSPEPSPPVDTSFDAPIGSPLLKDNPLFDEQEFQYDFQNPTYDREYGSKYDATVKIQTIYRGYRERKTFNRIRSAVITIQKFVRGFIARRHAAKYRVKRQEMLSRKKTERSGYLKGLALFDVKALGSATVREARGENVVQDAIGMLRKQLGGKRKKRLKISVSPHGVKLFNAASMTQLDHIRVTSVTYCSVDPKQKKVFAFIQKRGQGEFVCHVFHCTHNNADELAKTVSEAYSLVYQRVQRVRENKARLEAAQLAAKQATEEAKKLEDDLDVRLEEIEDDFADLYDMVHKHKKAKIFTASSSLDDLLEEDPMKDFSESDSETSSEDEAADPGIPKSQTRTSLATKSMNSLDDFAPTPLPLKRGEFRDAMRAMTEIESSAGEPGLDDAIAKFLRGEEAES